MLEKTDLEKCKMVAKNFLNSEIKVKNTENGYPIISHPFFNNIFYVVDEKNMIAKNILEDKEAYNIAREKTEELIDKISEYETFSLYITKPYRLLFLKLTKNYLSLEDYSKFLIEAWMEDECSNRNVNVSKNEVLQLFKGSTKQYLMSEEEMNIYNQLPDIVTIYRGLPECNSENIKALSWTLSENIAIWFAERFEQGGYVYKAKINKKDILAYCNGRNEEEVIVDYSKLCDIELLYEI